ncbi:exported hypothetical protein [Candidatus Sulfopaludibacter sp. SbA3]|nr:exported hypothetical protein [Candidatus Sulfopaludibacter sp. SbA3]
MKGGAITLILAIAQSAARQKPAPDVSVYLTASEATVSYPAKAMASSMFQAIGVEVAWLSGEPKAAPSGITVRIHLAVDTPTGVKPGALAVSRPYAGFAKEITVFYDRVRRLAEETRTPERILLAHVLAHEITHVIEQIDRHSETGLMKERWSREDYTNMARKPLPFSPDDLYWIRQRLNPSASTHK